jgi:uncharacterized membrane protein YphA (DoxX/SURF4 family)
MPRLGLHTAVIPYTKLKSAVGLGTRWAALLIFVNIFTAWSLVHHFQFFGRGAASGEAMVLYLGGFLATAIMGPGRFSLDYKLRLGSFVRSRPTGTI